MPERHEVLVVGGGIMGASACAEFARRSVDVLLVEASPEFGGTDTSKTAGVVRTNYSNPEVVRIALRGRELLASLPDRSGEPPVFHEIGYVFLVAADALERARRNAAMQRAQGAVVEELAPAEIGRFVAMDDREGIVALFNEPLSGYAESVPAVRGLVAAARRDGATARSGVEVRRIVVRDGRVFGIETDDGTVIEASTVVVAAGSWSQRLVATAGVELPIEYSLEQELLIDAPRADAPRSCVSNMVEATYMRPELEEKAGVGREVVLLGRGFPKPYPTGDPDRYPDGSLVHELSEDLRNLVARRHRVLAEAPLVRPKIALYDYTPDWHPIAGPTRSLDGLLLLTGGSGHGFKLAPALGEMVASEWAGDPRPYATTAMFSLDRFATGDLLGYAYGGNRA